MKACREVGNGSDALFLAPIAPGAGKRGNRIALSVPPVKDSKCWRREMVESIFPGSIKD